jgi:L-ascorbate metabolism protein UlaG (beta-lactamase superfamily)
MIYNIISSGSKGNAVLINKAVLVDMGVSYKAVMPYINDINIILLTHIHSDHFRHSTIKQIAENKPLIRFVCGEWLVEPLLRAGVQPNRIDVVEIGYIYSYTVKNASVHLSPVKLYHDVQNYGYRININGFKIFYATDTSTLDGISAKNYNLYMMEANYGEEEIKMRIDRKMMKGEFAYELKAKDRHLSKQQADKFIYENAGGKSEYVYLHCHDGVIFEE